VQNGVVCVSAGLKIQVKCRDERHTAKQNKTGTPHVSKQMAGRGSPAAAQAGQRAPSVRSRQGRRGGGCGGEPYQRGGGGAEALVCALVEVFYDPGVVWMGWRFERVSARVRSG